MSLGVGIDDYPDYLICSDGRVFSKRSNKFLKPSPNERGYLSVELWKDGKRERKLIHRLVANAFIPNPHRFPQINHKDECPANNDVSNLEWCTAKYNMNYGQGAKTRHLKIDYTKPCYRNNAVKNGKKVSVPVAMITNGAEVARFESAKEASRVTGVTHSNILRASRNEGATAGGYTWKRLEVLT